MPKVIKQLAKPPVRKKKLTGSVLDRIEDLHFDDDEGINCAFYGNTGTGKTSLWGTFPGKILAVICSGKGELRTLNSPEYRKKIKQVSLRESRELPTLVEYAIENQFATIVLDHATGFNDLLLAEVLGLDEIPVQKDWGMASREEYGAVGVQFKKLIRQMLEAPMNTVIVAQEKMFGGDDDEGNEIQPTVGVSLGQKTATWLNSVSDYICQTYIRRKMVQKITRLKSKGKIIEKKSMVEAPNNEVEYCLRTAPHPVYMTRFRVPRGTKLPECIVDPSYDKIKQLLSGE